MATFKPTVRGERRDGFMQVYIRVTHRTKHGYIKTDKTRRTCTDDAYIEMKVEPIIQPLVKKYQAEASIRLMAFRNSVRCGAPLIPCPSGPAHSSASSFGS